jgi:hypothetical protein
MTDNVRRTLYHRSRPMGIDVAEAISAIAARDEDGLPLAITREIVAKELVRIANTDDNGEVIPLSASSERLVEENFRNLLATSSVFQSGYKHYEKNTGNQVVPVTDYFFKAVYDDGARDCLDAMTDIDLQQSLPKRPSISTDEHGNPLEGEAGETVILVSGKIAGIVIFQQGVRGALAVAWLARLASVQFGNRENDREGVLGTFVRRLGNAKPDSVAVGNLKESAPAFTRDVRAALPRPKR